jgi:hypothetical protein
MCLNSFIIECHEMMKTFFRECCNVEELEEHFSMHEFTEATMISRPVLYISLQVCSYLMYSCFAWCLYHIIGDYTLFVEQAVSCMKNCEIGYIGKRCC